MAEQPKTNPVIEGGPKENHINFCPFCGKQVVITIYESEEDDDV